MKFLYEYRSSDNIKHDGVVCAQDRDSAFVVLKSQGIRPCRLVEAPGVLNKLFGKGKRWMAIILLGAISCGALVAAFSYKGRIGRLPIGELSIADSILSSTRHQVIGDTAVIELGIRDGWSSVFEHEGDRFLASFAIPGVPAGLKQTTSNEFVQALGRCVVPTATDSLEARQIKSIVEGMKDEARQFIKAGGSVAAYGRCLVRRQEQEMQYYNLAKTDLARATDSGMGAQELKGLWQRLNEKLRRMGIRSLPLPDVERCR